MHKCGLFILATLAALLAPVFADPAFGQQSASYAIPARVLSDAGFTASSASYKITGTVGQPSPAGYSTSADYTIYMGYLGEALVGQATAQQFLFLPQVLLEIDLSGEGQ